jgi:hypothetical protein
MTSPKGGPTTDQGKTVASRNAVTHGLTAKRWINPVEHHNYQTYLAALNQDYQPQTVMEQTLIEALADIKTRLERFHGAEDSLFHLAQEQAGSPDLVANSFGIDDQAVIDDLSDHAFGIENPINSPSEGLSGELIRHTEEDISGWGYITNNMPLLRAHIIEECEKEGVDIEQLMGRYKENASTLPVFEFFVIAEGDTYTGQDNKVDQSGPKVPREYFIAYIKALYKLTKRRFMVNAVMVDFDNRAQLLQSAALPDGQTLDRIMRYRTALERQFSRTLGELLHIIKLRES